MGWGGRVGYLGSIHEKRNIFLSNSAFLPFIGFRPLYCKTQLYNRALQYKGLTVHIPKHTHQRTSRSQTQCKAPSLAPLLSPLYHLINRCSKHYNTHHLKHYHIYISNLRGAFLLGSKVGVCWMMKACRISHMRYTHIRRSMSKYVGSGFILTPW